MYDLNIESGFLDTVEWQIPSFSFAHHHLQFRQLFLGVAIHSYVELSILMPNLYGVFIIFICTAPKVPNTQTAGLFR